MTNSQTDNDYYPYLSRDEKIEAYKKAIIQSLGFAVHPEHLNRVQMKLDKLREFWEEELKLREV